MNSKIDIPFQRFVLQNGLTLITHEDRKAPIVSVNVWYHVGSKNERPGKTGFAHLFEHLMFNGSESHPGDYIKAMEAVGATSLNGTTNNDRTNYFQNVPTPTLDFALWMESDRMGHLLGAIDQAKLDEQRGVVKNEKKQGQNQPYAVAHDLLTQRTYPYGHPYSWTVIGEMEDIDAASLDDVRHWFERFYGAANATLVVSGDIDAATALDKVQQAFGDIDPGPIVPRLRSNVARRFGEDRETVEDRVPQARVYKVWNVPGWGTREAVAFDLITDVLADGKNSRLYKRLVYEEQIATSASASIGAREIGGQLSMVASVQPGGDVAAVEAAIDIELARFLREGPTADELERIRIQHRAELIRGVERIGGFGGKADILAKGQVFADNPEHYLQMNRWTEELTAEDLIETAREWLTDGSYVLGVQPAPERSSSSSKVDRSKAPISTGKTKLSLPHFEKATLSNGLQVTLAQRHEIPTVELSLIVDAGFAADQFTRSGVATMTMAMLDEGTASRTSLEIEDQLDRLGAGLGGRSGLDTCYVGLSALTEQFGPSLELFADVICNPSFPEGDFQRLKRQRLARIEQEKSAPSSTAFRLLPQLLFGSAHAYGTPLTGSGYPDTVTAMTREDLVTFHRTWLQPSRSSLAVVGDVTLAELLPLLEQHLGQWRDSAPPPLKNTAEVPLPDQRAIYLVDKPGAHQSVVIGGLPALPTNNPHEPAIEMMNAILGGDFASRINQNIREEKHWSYGARTMFLDAKGPRPFLLYAPVQADKTKETLQELDLELRGALGLKHFTDDELNQAKNNATLSLPGSFETKLAVIGAMQDILIYGLPEDHFNTYSDRINAVTIAEAEAAAKRILDPDRVIWIVVGDAATTEGPLSELGWGPIRHMDAEGNLL
ncbi:MAG: pitrilysin family protein [Acidobacteria bacterium]|nr:pitrilysin family protein [Acidobacteriota bacterium]